MDFNTVIKKRKSVRSFKTRRVSWKDVLEAVHSSLQGPFAGNMNHLKFLLIENSSTIKKISSHCQQPWISESNFLVLLCSDDTHLENKFGERGRVYSRQQAGAVISTFLLKLTDLGLSSCWVGAYSDELIKQMLKIPEHIQIEAIIPIGYEDKVLQKPVKKELESVLYWEEWKKSRRPPLIREKEDKWALTSPTSG